MTEYIFDPIEAAAEAYLTEVLDVPVFAQLPKELPAKFVQVNAVGGGTGVVTQHPMVTFICWDISRAKAARLASVVMARMRACQSLQGLPVYRVRTIGLPVERPDESGKKRFQFTLELRVRGRNFTPA